MDRENGREDRSFFVSLFLHTTSGESWPIREIRMVGAWKGSRGSGCRNASADFLWGCLPSSSSIVVCSQPDSYYMIYF